VSEQHERANGKLLPNSRYATSRSIKNEDKQCDLDTSAQMMKRQSGFVKVGYRGLMKNAGQVLDLSVLINIELFYNGLPNSVGLLRNLLW
ncbi:MAG: hypothetical protein PHX54_11580, partial [Lentimicrobiaceae bacterium]|nr:hypothetical protein [Lentimicrobiaceae bacterium]